MGGCGGVAREALRAGQAFEVANKATVIIAKRQGATGSVHMRFDRQFTEFSDLAHKAY